MFVYFFEDLSSNAYKQIAYNLVIKIEMNSRNYVEQMSISLTFSPLSFYQKTKLKRILGIMLRCKFHCFSPLLFEKNSWNYFERMSINFTDISFLSFFFQLAS